MKVEDLQFDGPKVFLRGTTDNVNAAANFVENVKADPMFTVPEGIAIQKRKDTDPPQYDFEFRFQVRDRP